MSPALPRGTIGSQGFLQETETVFINVASTGKLLMLQ